MNKHFRILMATDYSEAAMNAELYAIQFAKSNKSVLFLLHVYDSTLKSVTTEPIDLAETTDKFQKSEQEILELHRDKLFQSLNIKPDDLECVCNVREGSAAKQILEEAKESDADIIIVGTHGATGFRSIFFGTHTWDVIKKSGVPVLSIPKDGVYHGIKNIAFALMEREGEIPALNFLVQLAKPFDSEITAVHITSYALSKEFEADMFIKFRKQVTDKIHYEKLNLHLEYNEDIIQGLEDFCTRTKPDWLVMSPEKSSLFEKIFIPLQSLTKKMSFHTHVPLLSIPDYYDPEYSEFWKMFELDEKYLDQEI
jgi:nucleotide-binding universal stress UspA family protein